MLFFLCFMCLNPKRIVNPAHTLHLGSGQPLYINIPCGHCSECLQQELSEWRLRARYEALGTSHYVYFDTLTFSEQYLPHLSDMFSVPRELDFPCFNRKYVQDFLKRLRQRIVRAGYDSGKIRYFIASEYGSQNTRRPHHHIALYVNDDIDVHFLSKCVSDCWQFGITDGFPYKTYAYVMEHNYLPVVGSNLKKIVNYITKYITKDLSFATLAYKRLSKIKEYDYQLYNDCIPYLRCWHLQSKGFGYNTLLKIYSPEYLAKNLFIPAVNSAGQPCHITLPASLIRKAFYLYYRLPFDENNKLVRFVGTSRLVEFNQNMVRYRVSKLRSRLFVNDNSVSETDALNILFFNNRLLGDLDNVNDIIKYSYRIGSGLYNYSARDIGVLHKRPVITNIDCGTKSTNIQTNYVLSVNDLCDTVGLMFLDMFDEKFNWVNERSETIIENYNRYIAEKGDTQLPVQKLLHRLKQIHSNSI